MPVSPPSRLRACCAAAALLAAGVALSACSSVSETIGPAFVDPSRYELYDCKQLENERKALANRTADLQKLMDKAETGTGGVVISELAYRNDYIAVRGAAQLAEDAWRRNRCRETPPPEPPPPVTPPAPAAAKPAPKSGKAAH
jgi:hypothetical protein